MTPRHGPRIDDWRPAPFGRIRKVLPHDAARWRERRPSTAQAKPARRDYTAQAAQLAELDAAGLTLPQQAAQLGVKYTTLMGLRRRLFAKGLLMPRRRGRGEFWNDRDCDRLIELVERGFGYDAIAKKLRRTRTAVVIKCKRLGVQVTTTEATLSARDVAAQLGIPCSKTVTHWIKIGWLPARNAGGAGCHALWRITWEDLTAMLERRDRWMAWDPARIPDPALREWANELRAAAGGRWLSIGEVAEQCVVGIAAVNQWIRKGWLPTVRWGNWWVWSADVEGWVLPAARSRKGIPKLARRVVSGKAELRALHPADQLAA